MPKNATVMIHKPSASYFFTTKNADDLRKDAESLDTCQEAIMQTYMTKAKVDKEEIEQKVNDEQQYRVCICSLCRRRGSRVI